MALILHPSSSVFSAKRKNLILHCHRPFILCNTKPINLSIKSQDSSSESSKPATIAGQPIDDTSPAVSERKPTSPSTGFGFSSSTSGKSNSSPATTKRKQKGKRERAPIIRKAPIEKPKLISQPEEAEAGERSRNESAFLLAWLGLGGIILVEGIVLAASGFLPEEWDSFFVKYLYPSFTPTVFLFIAGTVAYGVLKYLQSEELKKEK